MEARPVLALIRFIAPVLMASYVFFFFLEQNDLVRLMKRKKDYLWPGGGENALCVHYIIDRD